MYLCFVGYLKSLKLTEEKLIVNFAYSVIMSRRIGTEAKLPSVQLSALENMHYSHMIRFDNVIEAR